MPGESSNALSNLHLDWLFRPGTAVTRPTAIYLGLATAAPSDSTTLTTVAEVTGDVSYARVVATTAFGAPADVAGVQTTKNSAELLFNFATGGTAITHAFLTDAASGTVGTLYFYWTLTTPKTPGASDTLKVDVNGISAGNE